MFEGGSNTLQKNSERITILLADDSEAVRRVIRQLLAGQSAIEIVGEAADFAQTVRMARDLNPQILILDLHMPDDRAVPAQELRAQLNHDLRVLAISLWNDEATKHLAECFGATILLDKTSLANTLVPTIRQLGQQC